MGGRKNVYLKVHEDHHGYASCGRRGPTTKDQAAITCARCLDSRSARKLARKGICKDCRLPVVQGRAMCAHHLEKHRMHSQRARQRATEKAREDNAALAALKEKWL